MNEIEVTFAKAAQIWWAWLWRTMIVAFICGLLSGVLVGIFGAILGFDQAKIALVSGGLGATIGIFVGIFILKIILKKKFSTFRIALIRD